MRHVTTTPRVRMSPASRREQLLELGVRLLATRPIDEISIELLAEEAGISRGLLYHYFGNKREFHRAVVRRAADELIEVTAPSSDEDPLQQLMLSLGAYLDYVGENFHGYVSLVRAAAGGDEDLREIYEEARAALTDRLFDVAGREQLAALGVTDSAATRLMVRGWSALTEEVVISWVRDPAGVGREELLSRLAYGLVALVQDPPV
ncbi:MAG TPA: TetR/AcrR family transcriptional regulator [Marmoricola sp.]|nr:TetR/AcrR family transcriptional regulator [Marmoricola sp.]